MTGLTWQEFEAQLKGEDIYIDQAYSDDLCAIVIRTDAADFHIAAVHREGTMLVLDMGQAVEP